MLKHNLYLILRSFKRFKTTFIINLIGLSAGLTSVFFIYMWVSDELAFDRFHDKGDRLYQVMEHQENADLIKTVENTPDPLADALKDEFPEVEYATLATPLSWFQEFTITTVDEKSVKGAGQFVGKEYFSVFSYNLIHGDEKNVLEDQNSIVISESLALSLFNTAEEAIGKRVEWQLLQFKKDAVISGVFEDVPRHSSDQFDFVLSFELFANMFHREPNWGNNGPHTYVVLKDNTDVGQFNTKISGYIKEKYAESNVTLFARQYEDRYLYGNYENGVQAGGRIEYVKMFAIIAVFILLIACINFMNLSTAKASRKIKEVGVKKAIGVSRQSLVVQYLAESVLMAFISLALAVLIIFLFMPKFNEITGKDLAMHFDTSLITSMVGITLFTGLISGSYPAIYMSGFKPAIILKGKFKSSLGELWARKGLVIFQFTLSVIFIVSVVVIYNQMKFIQSKNLGYSKDNVIYFEKEGKVAENLESFLIEVNKIPGVSSASSRMGSTMGSFMTTGSLEWPGKNTESQVSFENVGVNYDFIKTLGIEVLDGRSFSKDFISDNEAIIFNEAAIEVMGMENPVGQTVNLWGGNRQIIGVVKNFHFESLHEQVKPLFFILAPHKTSVVLVKLDAGRTVEAIDELKDFYMEFAGSPMDYQFLDAAYEAQYASEKRVSALSKYFAALAIIISCLGLFGLATFTAERRLKEIGIRKALGANNFSIIYLLSLDFTKMVMASILVAIPISYFMTQQWLANFAFSIELEIWYFVGAGVITLLIAWLTVSMQTIKAAMVSPVKCLKTE
ncbi:ABC transporter permease [Fulvivirga sp. 29W222]|uniref:ABC transporter permease n=1 Tax=Fulvivirga marina TaxID=2494733 RepID=A0A937G4D6_9BACT|nr:ABC transporter permease [Fulvivirga marina]MBL6448226.1 ABC transporter permease [Fulvivirga marina]